MVQPRLVPSFWCDKEDLADHHSIFGDRACQASTTGADFEDISVCLGLPQHWEEGPLSQKTEKYDSVPTTPNPAILKKRKLAQLGQKARDLSAAHF